MKNQLWKKSLAMLLAMLTLFSALTISIGAETLNSSGVDVRIESFMRGYQDDIRASELLVAKVTGYEGNVEELTYEWRNTLGTYLYVYNSHNMYYINNTDGEIEIYNDRIKASTNMAGRTYKDTFSGEGYCWAAIYGSSTSGAQTSIDSKSAFNGTITVTVRDKNGNALATDSHTGKVTTSGFWWWETTTYSGIVESDLGDDMDNVTIGIFKGDKRNVKDLLGESAILHITCVESYVNNGKIVEGTEYISLTGDATNDYYIEGINAGESTDENGDAKVELTIQKKTCKFHADTTATATTTVYVFEKPTTSTTAYTLTLDKESLDKRCEYFINGKQGKLQADGSIIFENLNPNTQYMVEVRGKYTDEGTERYAYAYVYDTTKPVYTGTVEVYLDGKYDSATHTVTEGKLVNLKDVSGYSTLYVKEVNGTEFIELQQKTDGVYSSVLDTGSYHLYYEDDNSTQIDQQLLTMHNADRKRYLFFNSVTYLDGTDTFATEYYVSESVVNTIKKVPAPKADYVFVGWKETVSGTVYSPDSLLTDHISGPLVLEAVWAESRNVSVNIVIDHTDKNGGVDSDTAYKFDVAFDLMHRVVGSSSNFTDVLAPVVVKEGDITNENYTVSKETDEEGKVIKTTYTAKEANLTQVAVGMEYSVEIAKSGYEIKKYETVYTNDDSVNGDVTVTVYLKYDPKNADLFFDVQLDEASLALVKRHPEYMPKAANVKVLAWYSDAHKEIEANTWEHISQHHDTFVTVNLDPETGKGTGSYPVWMHNSKGTETYYYRIKVVSYVLQDGTVIETKDVADALHEKYVTTDDRYHASIHVGDEGACPDDTHTTLTGAYFDINDSTHTQKGTLLAEIKIPAYSITFEPEKGKFSDGTATSKTVTEQIIVPDLSEFTPTREGGYVFDGWHTKDKDGNLVDATVKAGNELYENLTLYADWKEPLKIEGQVFVAGYYHLPYNPDVTAKIPEHDRTHAVTIYLQKLLDNNYAETIVTQKVEVTYEDAEGNTGSKPMGTATYSFPEVPDDGHNYRILIQNPNYTVSYQNEPDSVNSELIKDFENSYKELDNFTAVYTAGETDVATINAFMEFTPQNFDLKYQVIASSIGKDYRPDTTEILILCDDGKSGSYPQNWPVISQMVQDNENIGQENGFDEYGISQITTSEGNVSNIITYPAWMVKTDGHSLYDYAVSLDSYKVGSNSIGFNAESAPFYVSYNGSARYSAREDLEYDHQTQLLTVELLPKRYTVTFDPGFTETIEDYITEFDYRVAPGQYQTSHIWSYETILTEEPTRPGYKFTGWVDENDNPVTSIDASVANDVTLKAQWVNLFTVTFHTNNDAVDSKGIYRVYYEPGNAPEGALTLNNDHTVTPFYDLPVLTDSENNKYIFKGWYFDKENEDNPIDWNTPFSENTNIYAHWIKVESVAQDVNDSKEIPYPDAMYPEYDLVGVQIRDVVENPGVHFGKEGTGLRFVAVLGEDMYAEINNIRNYKDETPNKSGAEYGFVAARTDTTEKFAEHYNVPKAEYRIEYCGDNVNGVNTNEPYRYVQNLKCSTFTDHRNYGGYRLYTFVVTYDDLEDEALETAHNTPLTARAYLRYHDANGLYRTYYNNYTGTFSFGGCSASFAYASNAMIDKVSNG